MATQKVNAVAQAAQTLAQPVKARRAPGAGRATKEQGQAVSVTWDQIPELMKKATKADDHAVSSWVSLTDRLWVLGVRPSDFEAKDENQKGLARFSETFRKIRDLVIGSYTDKAQSLIKSPTLSLGPDARALKTVEEDRLVRHLRTICAYLKKLETKDGKPGHQATLAETLVKELKEMKARIKRAKESRITFDIRLVNEAIDVVIAELT